MPKMAEDRRQQGPLNPRGPRVVCFIVVAACALTGCDATKPIESKQPAKQKSQAVRTQVERGPVKVIVEASPNPVRLSDEPTLVVTIEYESGVEVQKPPFGEAIGNFLIRDFHEPLPEFRGNRQVIQQVYKLEPVVTGLSHIDPIVVHFVDNRPGGDGKSHQIETDALAMNVVSEITDAPSLTSLKGIEGPRQLPEQGRIWPWWLAGGISMAAIVGLIWYRRKKAKQVKPSILSPREQAEIELEALNRSPHGAEDVKRFYVELTAIVRRYIERTTMIHAPEQTTEEFLREVGASQFFLREERQRLKDFLESADLVKFAAFRPVPDDIEEAYRRARAFVGLELRGEAA